MDFPITETMRRLDAANPLRVNANSTMMAGRSSVSTGAHAVNIAPLYGMAVSSEEIIKYEAIFIDDSETEKTTSDSNFMSHITQNGETYSIKHYYDLGYRYLDKYEKESITIEKGGFLSSDKTTTTITYIRKYERQPTASIVIKINGAVVGKSEGYIDNVAGERTVIAIKPESPGGLFEQLGYTVISAPLRMVPYSLLNKEGDAALNFSIYKYCPTIEIQPRKLEPVILNNVVVRELFGKLQEVQPATQVYDEKTRTLTISIGVARTYSKQLITFVKLKEAPVLTPYNNGKTIGYGFDYYLYPNIKINWSNGYGSSITQQEAERLLIIMLDQSQNQINEYFDANNLKVDQYIFDALTDLFYNRNSNDLTKEIALAMAQRNDEKVLELFNDFDYRYALEYLFDYDTIKAQTYIDNNPGLIRRRNEEYSIYKNSIESVLN